MLIFYKSNEQIAESADLREKIKAASTIAAKNRLERDYAEKKLSRYESFIGRIDFSRYQSFLNFENNIYFDKILAYSTISTYDKKFIPEYAASALATIYSRRMIRTDFRAIIEQYMHAVMANMDYHNFAITESLASQARSFLHRHQTFLFVLGVCPPGFDDNEYEVEMKLRLDVAQKLKAKSPWTSNNFRVFYKSGYSAAKFPMVERQSKVFAPPLDKDIMPAGRDRKLTQQNIAEILSDVSILRANSTKNNNYNLVIVTSTFHISKAAHELERALFHESPADIPKNIVLIGTQKFYQMFANDFSRDKATPDLRLKRKQSFLFETFLHALDRNSVK